MFRRVSYGFRRASDGPVASILADGAEIDGDGTLTFPDGTVQRPGTERVSQTLTAAGNTITHGASVAGIIAMDLQGAATLTLTSTPTIEAGSFDGQIMMLHRQVTGTQITIQDLAVLAGSTLRLDGGANKVLTGRDVLMLRWDATNSEWRQISTLQALG